MSGKIKTEAEILQKLHISQLNEMQEEAKLAIQDAAGDVILLSPTGTGKTLAFLLPIIARLNLNSRKIQALIIAPSRELAIQIEQVARSMGAGIKVNVFYGGRKITKDFEEMKRMPAILVGTPGRIADHLERESFEVEEIKYLVLDEFDKSLEVGFEKQMKYICEHLIFLEKRILTSATSDVPIPKFARLKAPVHINYLKAEPSNLRLKRVISPIKDKLKTLVELLCHLAGQRGIVFCNYKDSIQRVSTHLSEYNIEYGIFYGGMEQRERERALIKFRNGTHHILLATDLAARGIDVPELDFIIHYHLPLKQTEFIHRNGRTARMQQNGVAYLIHWKDDVLPDFVNVDDVEQVKNASKPVPSQWSTIFVSGGRRDNISKGDIAGLFFKQGNLQKKELGRIELKTDCAFVAVSKNKTNQVINLLNNSRVKKRKLRIHKI